jgi:hypothetical protein
MSGITFISRDYGVNISIVRLTTTDSLSTVAGANYILNQAANISAANEGPFTWQTNDMILVSASNGLGFFTINSTFTSLVAFAFSTTVISPPVVVGDFAVFGSTSGNIEDLGYLPSNVAYTSVVMANTPTIANQIPVFNDTAGSITDSGVSIVNSLIEQTAVSSLTAHSGGGQGSALALTHAINNVTTVAAAGDSVKLPTSVAGLEITITNSGANSMQVFGTGTDTINGITDTVGVAQLPGQTVVYTSAVAGNWLANVSSNPNPILFASVALTAAQFKGMYAAPVVLVAAPGANKLISVESMELIMTFGSADYAAGGVVFAQYDSTADGAGVAATNTEAAADFFAAASTTFQFIGVSGNTVGALPFSTTVNKGLYLSNATQAFTTGDSTWVVKVYYRIVNVVGAL